jgi:molybdopterin converting factor small subunit
MRANGKFTKESKSGLNKALYMQGFTLVEIVVTATVIGLQVRYFAITRFRAKKLSSFFPQPSTEICIGAVESELIADGDRTAVELKALLPVAPEFVLVLDATNLYIKKNRGLPIEFTLVQGIAERASANQEQAASANVSVPLYIGLMGTFLGVIIGLVSIANESSSALSDLDLRRFLGGVLIAMVGSLCGLMLSVLGKGRFLQVALVQNEKRKQDYLSFLQSELLPVVGHDVSTALYSLQRNLHQFNREFSENIGKFATSIHVASGSLEQQRLLLEAISNLNVSDLMGANAKLLTKIKSASSVLIGFVEATEVLRGAVSESANVVSTFAATLDRVKTFERSVNELGDKLAFDKTAATRTIELIGAQLDSLTGRTKLIEQFVDVEDTNVRAFVGTQREKIGELTIAAGQQLSELISEFNKDIREEFRKEGGERLANIDGKLRDLDTKLDTVFEKLRNPEAEEYHQESLRLLAEISANLSKQGFAKRFLSRAGKWISGGFRRDPVGA